MPTAAPPPECLEAVCKTAASSIHARLNWNFDPCVDFKNFSCSSSLNTNKLGSLRAVRSAQESVDLQMQRKYLTLLFFFFKFERYQKRSVQ